MKTTVLLLLLFYSVFGNAQSGQLSVLPLSSIDFKADSFVGYDKFGFAYFIENNAIIKKKDSIQVEYKNVSLGRIAKVDLNNPLKILLFYENFNTVVLLDNQLNEIQQIRFSENRIPIVVAATGNADQNRLWIYNSLTQQIGLYDHQNNEYKTITTPSIGNIKYYDSDLSYFQWIDENRNRFACNVYGNVSPLGQAPVADRMRFVNENWIFYSKENLLYAVDIKNNKEYPIQIAEKSFISFYATPQILSIFTTSGITNYKITLP